MGFDPVFLVFVLKKKKKQKTHSPIVCFSTDCSSRAVRINFHVVRGLKKRKEMALKDKHL